MRAVSTICACGLSLANLAISNIAYAQLFNPIPDFAPPVIAFDVQGGDVETWSRYLPCEANTAKFKAIILQSHTNPDWSSAIKMSLSNNPTIDRKFETFDAKRVDSSVTASLISDINGIEPAKSFAVMEVFRKQDKKIPYKIIPVKIRNGREYEVVVWWGNEGEVSVSIDGSPAVEMTMNKRVTTFGVNVSGAKAEIRNLQIGRVGPKPSGSEACAIS